MIYQNEAKPDNQLLENMRVNCEKCFGFCCVALYFSASDGFPTDKVAGKPCINLKQNFSCAIHKNLRQRGLKGCTAYDCFGAGQKVAQVTYKGQDWRQVPKSSKQMFDVFLIIRQLHEMLWYLAEALTRQTVLSIQDKISVMINETQRLTYLDANALIALDVAAHREKVNTLILQTSEAVRAKARNGQKNTLKRNKTIAGRLDCIGADLRKINLRGADLRGAFLIAADLRESDLSGADLIGADLRDANLKGAKLTDSLFITQPQINTAIGDANTKLPISLIRPTYWDK